MTALPKRCLSGELSKVIEPVDKQRIASSFGAAADTYDQFSGIQKKIGLQLLQMAKSNFVYPTTLPIKIADVGCGTGWLAEQVKGCLPSNQLTCCDLSEGMIQYAMQQRYSIADKWLVADMEALPFADNDFDLILSNFAMQWLSDPVFWLKEAYRCLKPGGRLLCSTLLPGTLAELKTSWQNADQDLGGAEQTHVNAFVSQESLDKAINESGFRGHWFNQKEARFYPSVKTIMAELKGIGAHNINQGRPTGMVGKDRIRRMFHHYEAFHTSQGYPATYLVGLLDLHKPRN